MLKRIALACFIAASICATSTSAWAWYWRPICGNNYNIHIRNFTATQYVLNSSNPGPATITATITAPSKDPDSPEDDFYYYVYIRIMDTATDGGCVLRGQTDVLHGSGTVSLSWDKSAYLQCQQPVEYGNAPSGRYQVIVEAYENSDYLCVNDRKILSQYLEICGPDSTNPCCGSTDPTCGNPCYGNPDLCCGSTDSCCGNSNACCGNPDPCCGSTDSCCGNSDPCCGSTDPCCGNSDPCCGSNDACCDDPDCGKDDDDLDQDSVDKEDTGPKKKDPEKTDPEDTCAKFDGEPVSLLSGAEVFERTDLTLGNRYPITIQRKYNSRSLYDSQIGYGWALNYDKRLYTYPGGSVTLRKESGWKRRFTVSGDKYVTPPGETGVLTKNTDGTYTYAQKSGKKEKYDAKGRLVSQTDANGNSLVFTYEDVTRLPLLGLLQANIFQNNPLIVSYDYRLSKIEEKDASGSFTGTWVTFVYNSSTGRLSEIRDSALRTVSYSQDTIGNLISVAGPRGNAAYGYGDAAKKHYITSTDEGQGIYENVYDAKGRVIKQTHSTGSLDFEYIKPYQQTRVTTTIKDSAKSLLATRTRTVEFGSGGQIAKQTDTLGNVTIYGRDGNGRLIRKEQWENTGSVSSQNLSLKTASAYTYDEQGNVLTETEAQGTSIEKTTTYTYHPVFDKVASKTVKSMVDPSQNAVTTFTYDDVKGNLLTITEAGLLGNNTPYSYVTMYGYDGTGKITSVDGPRTDVQDVVTYGYDSLTGFLTTMVQPLVGTTNFSNHDLLGHPRTVTDPNGKATTYSYDTIGRVLTVKAPDDSTATQIVYLAAGCTSCGGGTSKVDYIILPEGDKIDYDYDADGNLVKISDNAGNSVNFTYDSEGNRITEDIRDASGVLQKTLSYQYDALNRLTYVKNPDATYTQYGYNSRNSRTSVKNPMNNTTSYDYDALGRMIAVRQPGSITTSFSYNTESNLTTVSDANGLVTTYKYDDKGRVYQVVSPDTGTTTYSYDPAGNMVGKTDAKGVTITYVYDALNRLTKIDFPSDTDNVYSYDNCLNGKGRLCGMTDASGTTSYEYSSKGQVKKETKTVDGVTGVTFVTQYGYDMNGRLKTMTYPSGNVITYTYSNGRVSSVSNNTASLATNIAYKPFGGMSSLTYGNGITGSIAYNNQYLISGITAGTSMNLTYADDANGNITSIKNNLDATKNKSFGYDTVDRLISATSTGLWGSIGWVYDNVGNRKTQTDSSGPGYYVYSTGTNKLASITGPAARSFTFDSNGNTATEGTREFVYNQNQRLIRVTDGAMTKGEYVYNGYGQRVKKTVSGDTTVFHYSLTGQIIAESNSVGNISAEYVYLNGQPLAKIVEANTYYYHNDHLATPQKMTDASGTIVWAADYKPFGEATITVSTITNNLRFPGQYFDAETGLNYNYFRDYNPVIGRYIEADRIGLRGGINLYSYVGNKPVRFIDPWGLTTVQVGVTVNGQLGPFSFTGSAGIAVDGSGNVGVYSTGGGGAGAGTAVSGGVSVSASNAQTINDLSGPFNQVSLGGGWGPNASGDAFTGSSPNGVVLGGGITVGAGLGVGGSTTITGTNITPLFNVFGNPNGNPQPVGTAPCH